jgi:hypothetical protein
VCVNSSRIAFSTSILKFERSKLGVVMYNQVKVERYKMLVFLVLLLIIIFSVYMSFETDRRVAIQTDPSPAKILFWIFVALGIAAAIGAAM